MKKITMLLLLGIATILSCEQECKDVTLSYYTPDTALIPEMTTTERLCDFDLDAVLGTPQYFMIMRDDQWVLRCYSY